MSSPALSKQLKNKVMENNLEKQLTPEESLSIISASLEKSRKDTLAHAGTPMIWWGSLVLVFSLVIFFLWDKTGSSVWNCLWFVMCAIGYGIGGLTYGKERKGIRSFIPVTLGKVWGTFGILAISVSALAVLFLPLILRILPADLHPNPVSVPLTTLIVILLGCATTITGLILKNGWITAAGLSSGIVGTVLAIALPGTHQLLVLTGVSVIGLILPGLVINRGRRDE